MLLEVKIIHIIHYMYSLYFIYFCCLLPPGCRSFHLQICCIQSSRCWQRVKYVQLWIWHEFFPLDCLTMDVDVECRTFFSDAETVQCSSLMLWSLPTIKPGPRGLGGVGGARAAKSWNSLSFGLKLSYCDLDDSLNCRSRLPQAPKIKLGIDSRALSEFELLSIMFDLCLRIVPWNYCNRSLQRQQ